MRGKEGLQGPLDRLLDAGGGHLGFDAQQQGEHGFAFVLGRQLKGGQQGV